MAIYKNDIEHFTREEVSKSFPDISGEYLHEVLNRWIKLYQYLNDGKLKNNVVSINDLDIMSNELIAYGSKNTISICSILYKSIYDHSYRSAYNFFSQNNISEHTFEILFILGALISSIKNDFSGEFVDPQDIINISVQNSQRNT